MERLIELPKPKPLFRPFRFGKVFARSARYLHRINRSRSRDDQHALMRSWAMETLATLRVDCRILGSAPSTEPVLFVGNHLSYLDIPILMATAPVIFVVKKEIAGWPVFGAACRDLGMVFVDRSSPQSRKRVSESISQCLRERRQSIVVFPSGTTSLGETKPWRYGAFQLAHQFGFPIQPFRLGFSPRRETAFIDDDLFAPHLWKLLSLERISATIEFHPPVQVNDPRRDCEQWWQWSSQLGPRPLPT